MKEEYMGYIFIGLFAVFAIAAISFGIGKFNTEPIYQTCQEKDYRLSCDSICELNKGVDYFQHRVETLCQCNNGGLFSENDL